ncbi:hypothetical protein B0H11DRAFT_1920592 [Mycena galericulata]|nr:hypothetical protein B0H11DRAFT_1938453 [Mycena galericulata]KAJ7469360.1 hypothetical protein B0H11DRAFT_1920592 [Mycena galericulata]
MAHQVLSVGGTQEGDIATRSSKIRQEIAQFHPMLEKDDEGSDTGDSQYLTTSERRKKRRREASARYYHNAAKKAKKRRWDPPKKTKPIPKDDPQEAVFPSEDENLLESGDETNSPPLTYDEIAALFDADIRESEGTVPSMDDLQPDSDDEVAGGSATASSLSGPQRQTHDEALIEKMPAIEYRTEVLKSAAMDDPSCILSYEQSELRAQEAVAAETLARLAETVEARESVRSRAVSPQSSPHIGGTTTDGERGAPAIAVVVEYSGVAEDGASDRNRVFRGYRYVPTGPPPEGAVRPVYQARPASSGICGNCKSVEKCEKDGRDGQGLCDRCLDCTMEGYLCWDHFNGVKEWEEPWLW